MTFPLPNYPAPETKAPDDDRPVCAKQCNALQTDYDPTHFAAVSSVAELFRAYVAHPAKNVLLRGVQLQNEDVLKIASTLGQADLHDAFPDVREIHFNPLASAASIAMSAGEHPPHLDGTFTQTPPTAFLLSFRETDPNGGGTSHFWALPELVAACPWDLLEAGQTATVRYARRRHDADATDEVVGRIVEKDAYGRLIFRWRYDDQVKPEVVDSKGTPIQAFINWTLNYLQETPPITLQAKPGDTIVIRQRQYLHGRGALSSTTSPRLALRTWLQ